MINQLVLILTVCSACLDGVRPDGTQLPKCNFVNDKSCKTEADRSQHVRRRADNVHLYNVNKGGRVTTLASTVVQPVSLLSERQQQQQQQHWRQEWQLQQITYKDMQTSQTATQHLQQYKQRYLIRKSRSVIKNRQQTNAAYKSRQTDKRQSGLLTLKQNHESVHIKENRRDNIQLTYNMRQDIVRNSDINLGNINGRHHSQSGTYPNGENLKHDQKTDILSVNSSRERLRGKLLTESTTIHPFITTRQALDYLTSYDWKPPPRRWPITLILSEHEPGTNMQVVNDAGSRNADRKHGSLLQANTGRYPRSADHKLWPIISDVTRSTSEGDGYSNSRSHILQSDSVFGHSEVGNLKYQENSHFNNIESPHEITTTNENTLHKQRTTSSVGLMSTPFVAKRREGRKRADRVRQKLEKANKKSKKQKKQRYRDALDNNFITTVSNSALASLSSISTLPLDDDKVTRNTTNESKKTKGLNVPRLLSSEDREPTPVLTILAGTSAAREVPRECLSNTVREQCATSELSKLDIGLDSSADTISQSPPKRDKLRARGKKSESRKRDFKRKSKKFKIATQTENTTDNHMFVSLKNDFNAGSIFIPAYSQKVPSSTQVKTVLENYSRESSEVSSDNTRQIISDRTTPAHVRAHTNPGPVSKQVVKSSETWPLSPAVWNGNYNKTENISRSLAKYYPDLEMSMFPPISADNNTTGVRGSSPDVSTASIGSTLRNLHDTWLTSVTNVLTPSVTTTELSSVGFWKHRLRKKQNASGRGEVPRKETTPRESRYENKKDDIRTSLRDSFQKSTADSTKFSHTQETSSQGGNKEIQENGPFIGYKTAYDFLSQQKGPKRTFQNEGRREANELNRFMAEGMCEIFNKHYVPTSIGGKCQ